MKLWLVSICFALAALAALVNACDAEARPPIPADVFVAVRAEWHSTPERVKAFDIIACETGNAYNTTAENGQYLGLFQMGEHERAKFGHGRSARAQAHAARRYYDYERRHGKWGWSPWDCA